MKQAVFLIVCACLLSAGCGQREAAPPAAGNAAPPTADADAGVPSPRGPIGMPAAPASVVVADTGDENATLAQLTVELRRYVVRARNSPANFEEFVTKAGVQAPQAPAGKKYAISKGTVVLVKQ